jgi:hypothetical protein
MYRGGVEIRRLPSKQFEWALRIRFGGAVSAVKLFTREDASALADTATFRCAILV